MERKTVISLVFILSLFISVIPFSYSQDIPSSSRSRRLIERLSPRLREELSQEGFCWGSPIFIRIFKQSMELEVWLRDGERYRLFRTYRICTYGSGGLGPKTRQGDGKAPEGFYYVTPKQLNPFSSFHLSFNIGYPNRYDRLHGRTGGAIMVHGSCVSIGCFAMTDPVIEELYTLVDAAFRNGQRFFRIHIFPFRMTDGNMQNYRGSRWYNFWENLKEGYDFFERFHIPPNVEVEVRDGKYRYVFQMPDDYSKIKADILRRQKEFQIRYQSINEAHQRKEIIKEAQKFLFNILTFFGQLLEAEGLKSLVNTGSLFEKCQKGGATKYAFYSCHLGS